jgi:hypothetical protein
VTPAHPQEVEHSHLQVPRPSAASLLALPCVGLISLLDQLTVPMSELDIIRAKIEATEANIAEAMRAGRSEAYLISLQNTLTAQQNEKNLLLGQSAPTPGNPPSNKFLFELELYFLVICHVPTAFLTYCISVSLLLTLFLSSIVLTVFLSL